MPLTFVFKIKIFRKYSYSAFLDRKHENGAMILIFKNDY